MTFNRNFAKVKQDGTLDYGPIPLTVVTHHHEEWDEPVFDPETGEPTGETEHKSRDWDTSRREVFPTAADFRQMGYPPVDYGYTPSEPAPEGKRWAQTGKYVEADGTIRPEYAAVDIPPAPPRRWSRRAAKTALVAAGKWDEVKTMLVALDKYEDMLMCNYIEESNDDYKAAYDAAVAQYGKDAVDAIIDSIPTEVG